MHLPCLFKEIILHIKVAVIWTLRIILRLFDNLPFSYNIGKSGHSHKSLLRRSHTEINIVLINVYWSHRICWCCIHRKYRTVLMCNSTYLTYRIKYSCSCFIMCCVNKCNIRITFKCLFNYWKVWKLVYRKFKINIIKSVILTYLYCPCTVSTIIDNKNLLSLRK